MSRRGRSGTAESNPHHAGFARVACAADAGGTSGGESGRGDGMSREKVGGEGF